MRSLDKQQQSKQTVARAILLLCSVSDSLHLCISLPLLLCLALRLLPLARIRDGPPDAPDASQQRIKRHQKERCSARTRSRSRVDEACTRGWTHGMSGSAALGPGLHSLVKREQVKRGCRLNVTSLPSPVCVRQHRCGRRHKDCDGQPA